MKKRRCTRIVAALLCAAMLAPATGSALAQTAQTGAVQQTAAEQERFYGEHLGWTSTSVNWSLDSSFGLNANVDYASGNLYLEIGNPCRAFKLAYNAQDEGATNFGNRITSTYHQTILPDASGNRMIHTRDDGQKEYLEKRVDDEGATWWGWFKQQPNGELDLDGFGRDIYGVDGYLRQTRIPWLANLELMQIYRDPQGNVTGTSAHFDGSQGESLRVELDNFSLNGQQRSVEMRYYDVGNLTYIAHFGYDQSGNLCEIQMTDGLHDVLHYVFSYEDRSSRITQVTNVLTGEGISYRYTQIGGRYKVTFMEKADANGNMLDQTQFGYGDGQTVLIDKNGNVTVKTY